MMRLRREDPRVVGPYRLHRRLGTGGMGVVYLGSDRKGQKVALKLIRSELAEDQEFRTRFAREVAAAARIRGGCIARLVASDIDVERPWLATAYVPGPSLYKRVGDEGPLPWPEVTAIGAALADGLVHVHEAGVVHRDLKPSNILLSPKGPRIIDFGIAWSTGASTLTHVGTAVGSPGFLAPEQVRGIAVTSATDVFALGTTLAYAATGDSPFGSGTSEVMLYRVVHEEPDLSDVPSALLPVIRACLAKEASDRPTTAQLHDRLKELTARGTAIGLSQVPRPQARQNRPVEATQRARGAAQGGSQAAAQGGGRPPARPVRGRPMPPTVREPQPPRQDAQQHTRRDVRPEQRHDSRPTAPVPAPAARRTPPPTGSQQRPATRPGGSSSRRLLRQRLIVFITVTVGVALAIAAAQGCENRDSRGLGTTPNSSTAAATHPAAAAVPVAAPSTAADGLQAGPTSDASGGTGGVDWADRSYPDPSDGSTVVLKDGRGSPSGASPVALTSVLAARYRNNPAAVVVLTRRDGGAPEDLIELYQLSGGASGSAAEPVLLASHASTGDPQATGTWRIADGAVLREEHTAASGTRPASTTRYTPLGNGTMSESWPGTGTVAGQQG
ncbi:serine/threonine protein kinase [Streptomyces sp. 846.5]|nr:serine/threonine protein kinase [Streptomyces sp. 846.5]